MFSCEEFVRVADFRNVIEEMGQRLDALEATGRRPRTISFGNMEDSADTTVFEMPNCESNSLIASLQNEIHEIWTRQEQLMEIPQRIRKIEEDHARSWHNLEDLLTQHVTWSQTKIEDLEQATNRLAIDIQRAGHMTSMSRFEDAPSQIRASDLPGFKALQDLTSKIEKSGSSSKQTSQHM